MTGQKGSQWSISFLSHSLDTSVTTNMMVLKDVIHAENWNYTSCDQPSTTKTSREKPSTVEKAWASLIFKPSSPSMEVSWNKRRFLAQKITWWKKWPPILYMTVSNRSFKLWLSLCNGSAEGKGTYLYIGNHLHHSNSKEEKFTTIV